MLLELASPMIETLINQVIKLDPEARTKLQKLDGKLIKFELQDINQQLFFFIDEDYIVVKSRSDQQPHAELSGNSLSFFNLALSDDSDPLFKGEVRFAGEISTAQNFQKFFESLDIDWEEHLSRYTGDIAAHQIFKTGKVFHQWANKTFDTAKHNFSEYLRFEARAVPASIELENFFDDIADLKSDVDRLALRVERIIQNQQQA